METIIAEGQGSEENEIDGVRLSASTVLDQYLAMPIPKNPDDPKKSLDTFVFWKNYSKSVDTVQICLCELARRYLTPPPTSTDVERLGSWNQSNFPTVFSNKLKFKLTLSPELEAKRVYILLF